MMKFIDEAAINRSIDAMEASSEIYEATVASMYENQPVVLGYLFSENSTAFTEVEREIMLYMMLIVWHAVSQAGGPPALVTEEDLEEAEEHNWSLLEGVRAKDFNSRIDVLFEGCEQEDLLAFVEDALTEDEDDTEIVVTDEAREPIFVSMKSIIDCLTE